MADIDKILHDVAQKTADLAKLLVKKYETGAVSDAQTFLQASKADLTRWVNALELRHIDKDDFASLVRGEKDLAEMHSLKQAGVAQITLDTFVNGVLNILIDAAFSAVGI